MSIIAYPKGFEGQEEFGLTEEDYQLLGEGYDKGIATGTFMGKYTKTIEELVRQKAKEEGIELKGDGDLEKSIGNGGITVGKDYLYASFPSDTRDYAIIRINRSDNRFRVYFEEEAMDKLTETEEGGKILKIIQDVAEGLYRKSYEYWLNRDKNYYDSQGISEEDKQLTNKEENFLELLGTYKKINPNAGAILGKYIRN